ncbi:hypothetical protein [Streptomyces lunaelactis]|nr:hypothetical protein [Streptomyces lunaelactis]NUK86485.1 hypothetical protein [Streptomyces lunaelactis]
MPTLLLTMLNMLVVLSAALLLPGWMTATAVGGSRLDCKHAGSLHQFSRSDPQQGNENPDVRNSDANGSRSLIAPGDRPYATNRPADRAAAPKETAEDGPRPLAQAELAASRLTEQETAAVEYVSMPTDNTLETFADIKRVSATPAPCQPVADAINRGRPDGPTSYADVSYSEKDSALVAGYISLSSDSAAGSEKFFDAVKSSLEQCDRLTVTGRYGDTITITITLGPSDTVGDESISFTTSSTWKMPGEDGYASRSHGLKWQAWPVG